MNRGEPKQMDDAILLQQIAGGSEEAFGCLFRRYWRSAFSEVYKRIKDHDHSKDIVQEIFTHVWVKRDVHTIENFPAYLKVSIRNRVIKYATRQKRHHPFFGVAENITANNARADSNLLYKELYASYEALVKTLPKKRQTIFRLRYQQNLPTHEISSLLGISRKTVQNQLVKAIETLKVSLIRMFLFTIIFFLQ